MTGLRQPGPLNAPCMMSLLPGGWRAWDLQKLPNDSDNNKNELGLLAGIH